MRDAFFCTMRQLIQVDLNGGFEQMPVESPPGSAIHGCLSRDDNNFRSSKQVLGYLNLVDVNKRVFSMMILSLFILGVYLFKFSTSTLNNYIIVLLMILLICNAFVTGALANVLDRLQCRVGWVIPFLAIIVGLEMINPLINKFIQKIK